MVNFKFSSPDFKAGDIVGILSGAQSIGRAGHAEARGIAAQGAALGSAYASIGRDIGTGIVRKAEQDREEAKEKAATELVTQLSNPPEDHFYDKPFTEEEFSTDPKVLAIRDNPTFNPQAGEDPRSANARKTQAYAQLFMERQMDPQEAFTLAGKMTATQSERVMTPEGRAALSGASAALIGQHGMHPSQLRSLIDSHVGRQMYPRDADLTDDRLKQHSKIFGQDSPGAKLQNELQATAAKAQLQEQIAMQGEMKVDSILRKRMTVQVPGPTGGTVPTGVDLPPEPQKMSVDDVMNVSGVFQQQAESAGVDATDLLGELQQPEDFTPISEEQKRALSVVFQGMGRDPNTELQNRRMFTGSTDPNARAVAAERFEGVRAALNRAPLRPPLSEVGALRPGVARLIDQATTGGGVDAVPVGNLTSLADLSNVLKIPEKQLEKLSLEVDESGRVQINNSEISNVPGERSRLEGMVNQPATRDEVIFRLAAGVAIAGSRQEIQQAIDTLKAQGRWAEIVSRASGRSFARQFAPELKGGERLTPQRKNRPSVIPDGGTQAERDLLGLPPDVTRSGGG